ncbi:MULTISPECIES: N-acetylmuramate alpha-1-phosphate uridylyltransferase MurU [unclassified Shewanella]|uniref:N-acetylmuramate alpha-1-phosphate uridylyltransferase MurU n=1 Tax=unclassified Shewanella TaxID=196818 RepID=UPI0006D68A1E|nr:MULTISPECIES: nucleotidyltransferase family protein [unclassified Shewanella]KPZ71132.1 D-glycero-alpha-D-manno-heptose 1-phosphate guanylyltransferase [Shewanella sp. P1-14-1]MBQ4888761.1 nucleotidyltransferase family protein [Shewanella sp. MMG014]OBT08913.1 mannose-1-phosphate guanylyltransferase [Shewanella sp. UCD-FRSSP16_17]
MKAMILAAGRGERLRPLTDTLPKPMVKAAGKALIEYHLDKLAQAGFQDVIINHAWLGHKLVDSLGDGSRWGITIKYSAEQTALETAGGIKQALPLIGHEPFFVINGDIYIDKLPDITQAIDVMASNSALDAFLWLVDNPTHNPSGDFAIIDNMLAESEQDKLTYSGMGIYHPKMFTELTAGKSGLGPLLRQKLASETLAASHFQSYWCDVGTIERLTQLTHYIENQ